MTGGQDAEFQVCNGRHCSRLLGHDESGTGIEREWGENWEGTGVRLGQKKTRATYSGPNANNETRLARKRKKKLGAFTHLPWTLELDDLMAILVNVYFFLQAVSSILYEDEQERADEPRKGVPFHGRVSPCAREAREAL